MADKCAGCQSFCMLGGQKAGPESVSFTDKSGNTFTHTKSQKYPTDWECWSTIAKDKTIAGDSSVDVVYLSAINHNSLIDFINAAWNEGEINCSNVADSVAEWKEKHSSNTTQFKIIDAPTDSFNDNFKAASQDVIYPYHYNNFYYVLSPNVPGVTQDAKGDPVSGNPSTGPQVGTTSTKGKVNSEDLIYGKDYKFLYDQAKNLKYHPYQCNICNIFEGGRWTEIVEELGTDIANRNVYYSQTGSTTGTAAGYTVSLRTDCSGFVGACVDIFEMTLGGSDSMGGCASDEYRKVGSLTTNVKEYFTSAGGPAKGSIVTRKCDADNGELETEHVEVYGQWSGGGPTGSPMMHRISGGCSYTVLHYLYPDE